jgi:hypothetical protein
MVDGGSLVSADAGCTIRGEGEENAVNGDGNIEGGGDGDRLKLAAAWNRRTKASRALPVRLLPRRWTQWILTFSLLEFDLNDDARLLSLVLMPAPARNM